MTKKNPFKKYFKGHARCTSGTRQPSVCACAFSGGEVLYCGDWKYFHTPWRLYTVYLLLCLNVQT